MQVMPHNPLAELRFELEPDHRVKENHMIRIKAAFLNLTAPAPGMTMAATVHGPRPAPVVRSVFAGSVQTMIAREK